MGSCISKQDLTLTLDQQKAALFEQLIQLEGIINIFMTTHPEVKDLVDKISGLVDNTRLKGIISDLEKKLLAKLSEFNKGMNAAGSDAGINSNVAIMSGSIIDAYGKLVHLIMNLVKELKDTINNLKDILLVDGITKQITDLKTLIQTSIDSNNLVSNLVAVLKQ